MINLTLMFFSHSLTVRVYRLSCDTVTGTGWSFKSSLRHKMSSKNLGREESLSLQHWTNTTSLIYVQRQSGKFRGNFFLSQGDI